MTVYCMNDALLSQWFENSAKNLTKLYIERSLIHTELLHIASYCLKKNKIEILLHMNQPLSKTELELLSNVMYERLLGKPLSKIIGEKHFYNLIFHVNSHVLDPRPETECIIDIALKKLHEKTSISILDLGTGSGCIIVSIVNNLINTQKEQGIFHAIDISNDAIDIAKKNAKKYNLHQIQIYQSNWFAQIDPKIQFDLIVSNPPYLSNIQNVSLETCYDPEIALFSGNTGAEDYQHILQHAKHFLKPNGCILLEVPTKLADYVQNAARGYSSTKGYKTYAKNIIIYECMK